jgi:amino acid transporter
MILAMIFTAGHSILIGVYDAPIHMSEEAKNAAVVIPWTIISTIGSTLILGWGELDVLNPEREDWH